MFSGSKLYFISYFFQAESRCEFPPEEHVDDPILAGNIFESKSGCNLNYSINNIRSTPVKNSLGPLSPRSVLESSNISSPGSLLESSLGGQFVQKAKSSLLLHNEFSDNDSFDHEQSSKLESTGSFLESTNVTNPGSVLENSCVQSPASVFENSAITSPGSVQETSFSSPGYNHSNTNFTISHLESPESVAESSNSPGSLLGISLLSSTVPENSTSKDDIMKSPLQQTSPFAGSVLESSFVSHVSKL